MMGAHCQGLVMASDERLPGDVVASLDAAAVVKQLELHNVRHDANDDASCRAMLEQRLVDVIVLRQVQFALEWPGIRARRCSRAASRSATCCTSR